MRASRTARPQVERSKKPAAARRRRPVVIRTATPADAPRNHALIKAHVQEGHLLPRTLSEVTAQAPRFVVAVRGRDVVASAELMPLSHNVAEVRSLAVDVGERGSGLGRRIVDELRLRARREGYDRLCAFTHQPGYFVHMGFSIVPHVWLPEKIFTDCVKCPLFRACGQQAMLVEIESPREAGIELTSLPA